jgi:hypothetical protein
MNCQSNAIRFSLLSGCSIARFAEDTVVTSNPEKFNLEVFEYVDRK